MAGEFKADLKDTFARVSVTLLWAWAVAELTGLERAILDLVVADTWGRPEQNPGYVSNLTGADARKAMVEAGLCSQTGGNKAVRKLLDRQVLELHGRKLKINPYFPGTLPDEKQDTIAAFRVLHASKNKSSTKVLLGHKPSTKVLNQPEPPSTKVLETSTKVLETSTKVLAAYNKDARAQDLELEKTSSSSVLRETDKAATSDEPPKADDDEVSQELENPAPAALDMLTAKLLEAVRKIDDRQAEEHLASLDALTGLSNEQLELGVARILVAIIGGKMQRVKSTLGAAVAFAARAAHGQFEDVSPQELLAQISATKAAQANPAPAPVQMPAQDFGEMRSLQMAQDQLRFERTQYFKNASKSLLERVCGITGEDPAVIEPQFRAAFGKMPTEQFACFVGVIYRGLVNGELLAGPDRGLMRLARLAEKLPLVSPAELETIVAA